MSSRPANSTPQQRNAIAINYVNKVYSNGTVALQDMNLTIGEAEFISLVGPSGCGKSTALRLIAGFRQDEFWQYSAG
jgi:NitT/TauT family transport system ATP-binding protein